jgi:NADPH:quinone reductase-like Zn-dependent oxidoreductase
MSFTAMRYHRLLSAFAAIALGILLVQLIPSHIVAVAANPEGPTEPARHKLFLWRVSGGSGTVYLLGSVHVGKADLYPLPREIEQLFESSDFLVEETDFSKADPAQLRRAWDGRADFEAMNRAIALHSLRPVIDRTFPFAEAKAAYRHFESRGHSGRS